MPKKIGPYIGVTGFMSRVEVNQAVAMIPDESKHRLMVGVWMNSRTLAGQTNESSGRYPKREAIADIFVDDPRVLNLVRYNTDNPRQLATEVRKIVELVGPYVDGFQLNIAWPDPSQIRLIREMFPDLYLLLQIGGRAMRITESMEEFGQMLEWYIPEIDSILIDHDGDDDGRVQGLNFLRAARHFPTLGLGIAGDNLGPDMLYLLRPIIREFPDLSINLECDNWPPEPDGSLNLMVVRRFMIEAYLLVDRSYIKSVGTL